MRSVVAILATLLSLASFPPASAQGIEVDTPATIMLDKPVADAGAKIKISIHVDTAPNYEGTISTIFTSDKSPNYQFQGGIQLLADKNDATGELQVPLDAVGGEYKLTNLWFGITTRTTLKFDPVTLTIRPLPKARTPTSATVSFEPSEKQFLATNAQKLRTILDELRSQLGTESADTPRLRALLLGSLTSADSVVTKASDAYPKIPHRLLPSAPIFLEDFHLRFQDAINGLRSSSKAAHLDQSERPSVQLVRWGLDSRSAVHSDPLLALGVITMLNETIEAFDLSERNGTYYFTVQVDSIPQGAKVYYTRLKHPYESYPDLTLIKKMTLEYAYWTLLFEKDGCETKSFPLIPYHDLQPVISVPLDCHVRKKK